MVARSDYIPDRGDIIWFDFSPQIGREQAGRRPALVVSSIKYNRSGLAIVCPITSRVKDYPFAIRIIAGKINGTILTDQIKNQDWRRREISFITRAPGEIIKSVQSVIALLLIK